MKPPCFVNATARERGFTLLELMLAMAVTALLLVLLASVASQGLQNSRQINETVRMQSDATAALGMIASDLQALAIDVRPIEVLECQAETVRGVNSSWLMGLSRVYDNPGSNKQQNFGELRAFSYRMAYGDPVTGGTSGNTCVYGLYRKALTTGTTRSSILGAMLANPDQGLSMNYWNQTDATTGKSNATPGTDDYLVANIVQFSIAWTYQVQTTGTNAATVRITVPFPDSKNNPQSQLRYRRDQCILTTGITNARLVKATINLTLLPESTMRQLNGTQPKDTDVAKGRSFSRDVNFGMP